MGSSGSFKDLGKSSAQGVNAASQLAKQQAELEQQQAEELKIQQQQLLKRKLAAIRSMQGGNQLGGLTDETSTDGGLSSTIG